MADHDRTLLVGVPDDARLNPGTQHVVLTVAHRLGLEVELVHVVPPRAGGPAGTWDVGMSHEHLVRDAQDRLDAELARLRESPGGAVVVSAELVLDGGIAEVLVQRSHRTQLVVLQHRQLPRLSRMVTGSVVASVSAGAVCPVISVPADWRPAAEATPTAPVTVAVADRDDASPRVDVEVWTALGLAAAIDRPVRLLRAVRLSESHRRLLHQRGLAETDVMAAAREELVGDCAIPDSVCERVPCSFDVEWGHPPEVLVEASADSWLLVLARRDASLPIGSPLGPVVRRVLRESRCPVMVVEPCWPGPRQAASLNAIVTAG